MQSISDKCREYRQENTRSTLDCFKLALLFHFQGDQYDDKLIVWSEDNKDHELISGLKKEGFYLYVFKWNKDNKNYPLLISLSPLEKGTYYVTFGYEYSHLHMSKESISSIYFFGNRGFCSKYFTNDMKEL